MKLHEKYMSRCLQLAKNGLGTTYPNPMVGCVIVFEDRIIGEGWHQRAGEAHAEVIAINNADSNLLADSTLYVSLEPCSHFGKTPPCSDLIISKGIRSVVVGSTDPNPKVAGRGIERLRNSGVEVITGILKNECDELNKRFFTFHSKKRPYIILKWAQTLDGFIAPLKAKRSSKEPYWITNNFSRQLSHKLRSEEMAILVGTQTALDDNPSLTTRDWEGKNPLRMVIDKDLKIPRTNYLFDGTSPTLFITAKPGHSRAENSSRLEYVKLDFDINLPEEISRILFERNIQSLIVEGGTATLNSFVHAEMWDESMVFIGNRSFGEGIEAPKMQGIFIKQTIIKNDRLLQFKNQI